MPSISATRCVAPLPKTFAALKQAIASTTYQSATEASEALGYLLNSSSPIFSANLGDLIDRDLCGVGHHFENKFRVQASFPALDAAVTGWGKHKNHDGHETFVTKLLPSICEQACRYPDLIPKGMVDTVGPSLPSDSPDRLRKFTKDQLHCLLCNAFLCTFRRLSNNCASLALQLSEDADENINIHAIQCPMPSCNYDELLAGPPDNVHISKLEMILCYFDTMRIRSEEQKQKKNGCEDGESVAGASSSSPVTLIIARGKADPYVRLADPTHPNTKSNMPLLPVTMHPLRHSIDDLRDAIRVDFANKIIGGAVSYGNVQEEITFALCPELHVSRIMFECMAVDEAIVLVGAEQFALLKPGTYGGSMRCAGYPPNQPAELSSSKTSVIVAVDALDFRHHRATRQFSCEGFEREINKLAAGLKFPIDQFIVELQNGSPPTTTCTATDTASNNNAENQNQQQLVSPQGFRSNVVATGNWGCGVFRGDVMLKTILQWLCCSIYGKEMHYFPFDRDDIFEMGSLMNALIQQRGSGGGGGGATVADLEGFLAVLEESMRGGEGEGKRSRDHQQPPTRRFIIELFKSHFKLKNVSCKE